jgi:hypothetical protein
MMQRHYISVMLQIKLSHCNNNTAAPMSAADDQV